MPGRCRARLAGAQVEFTPDIDMDAIEFKVLLDFSLTVKAAPHECVIRTSQPYA